ncbi:MAG: hypothetical protein M1833_007116 [Piccolia ochrophora]|nr:MAG: hypothetical protein M1833_007116 [Piccolia ochrophora]
MDLCLLIIGAGLAKAQSASPSSASECSDVLTPVYPAPSVLPGYRAQLVADGLTEPRGILFDSVGHLLVVQQGVGISNLELEDNGGTCVNVGRKVDVVTSSDLNHGLALSADGMTLYASSADSVFSWSYDPERSTVSGSNETIISSMGQGGGHVTRTLLMSQKQENTLLVSRGSTSNVDYAAEDLSSGHCQIRAFQLDNYTGGAFNFNEDGVRLGWGLRNSVGLAEHPSTGGIYSVENSIDEITRNGEDIHENEPGEELNFHGILGNTDDADQGGNYGYPLCFATWDVEDIPDGDELAVGGQFAIGRPNDTVNDEFCEQERVSPRLTFQAHTAPLDIIFTSDGNQAFVSFHGSWDRTEPSGYKLSMIPFSDGTPVASQDNTSAPTDVMANVDNSICPGDCFRPVGLAFDAKGRLFMSSDATGEIYVIVKDESSPGTRPEPRPSDAGYRLSYETSAFLIAVAAVCLLF